MMTQEEQLTSLLQSNVFQLMNISSDSGIDLYQSDVLHLQIYYQRTI